MSKAPKAKSGGTKSGGAKSSGTKSGGANSGGSAAPLRRPPGDDPVQEELPFDAAGPAPAAQKAPPRKGTAAGGRKPTAGKPAGGSGSAAAKEKPPATPRKPAPAKAAGKAAGKPAARPKERMAGAGPAGFGGWLWLLAIGQLVVAARMIDTVRRMAGLVGTELWTDHPQLVATDLGLYGLALLLQVLVLGAMVLRSRFFRPLFLVAVVAFFLIGRIEPLLAITVLGMDPAALLTRATLFPLAIELAVSLVWGAYVVKSRRVANTFVR